MNKGISRKLEFSSSTEEKVKHNYDTRFRFQKKRWVTNQELSYLPGFWCFLPVQVSK